MKAQLLFSFRQATKSVTGHFIVVTTKCITPPDSVQDDFYAACVCVCVRTVRA